MQEFINSWWWAILCSTVFPIAWVIIKRFARQSENKVDDLIVDAVQEVIDAKNGGTHEQPEQPAAEPQRIVTPPLTEEQRSDLTNP